MAKAKKLSKVVDLAEPGVEAEKVVQCVATAHFLHEQLGQVTRMQRFSVPLGMALAMQQDGQARIVAQPGL